ncbi:uncharacterized protein HMPREF1541_04905 [Cyphellophora europaea CBS 101466]|uniref:AB hydrolase-1 domain-containing protein n=1 Tax=Cyphellophora europaea (strain CBS 101466) TaxID=1220924 RepID=W2RXX0_CYPE1|nr:uncharacterized protein HMPREF1541_04905 [Cyphellophora europaea CBS 101466]ETN40628.1 hypothetical protein HMPREF1541_04905 [Cyphellophora europaea CBS 101466]
MAQSAFHRLLGGFAFYSVALFTYALLFFLSIRNGSFFREASEKDENDLALERDRYWNLSKQPFPGFDHHFHTLRNGRKLHYVCNKEQKPQSGNLMILIHGFPDSFVLWKGLLQEPAVPLTEATWVAVDLPGYGGSDSFDKYDVAVLEALAEFIVAMRDTFLTIDGDGVPQASTYIVAHDWGAVLSFRLASEAPSLADRFILTNGPHVALSFANRDRIAHSSEKIFKQFRRSPWQNFGCLGKSLKALSPLFIQALMFGYIASFHLPVQMVKYLGTGGNLAFIRGCHSVQRGSKKIELYIAEALAGTLGPGPQECKVTSAQATNGSNQGYGESVLQRAKSPAIAFWHQTCYYRDGASYKPWTKSLETIADLYALDSAASESSSPARRRSSSSASSGLFTPQITGLLHAPATVLWGLKDRACGKQICLDGMGDYLAKDSEIVLLPRSGHWTPLEPDSRVALARVVGMYAESQENAVARASVTKFVGEVYEGAVQVTKK